MWTGNSYITVYNEIKYTWFKKKKITIHSNVFSNCAEALKHSLVSQEIICSRFFYYIFILFLVFENSSIALTSYSLKKFWFFPHKHIHVVISELYFPDDLKPYIISSLNIATYVLILFLKLKDFSCFDTSLLNLVIKSHYNLS